MQAIEFEGRIDSNGNTHIPEKYQRLFGQTARFVVLLPESDQDTSKTIDPMKSSNQPDWPVDSANSREDTGSDFDQLLDATKHCWHEEDGLAYQRRIRDEWQDDGENES